jgi:hypothetical protein
MASTAHELHVLLPPRGRLHELTALAPWLARANRLPAIAPGLLPVLGEYFHAPEGTLAIGALLRQVLAGDAGTHQWLCADPVWVQAEVNGARLLGAGETLGLTRDEARALEPALAEAFAAHGMDFFAGDATHWQVRLPAFAALPEFVAPEAALGGDLFQFLPPGMEGRRWRAVLGEVQITLHNHPVNQARRARGLAPVNSVWLWGGGALPAAVESGLTRTVGNDLMLWALAGRADVDAAGLQEFDQASTPFELLDLSMQPVNLLAAHWWPVLGARLRDGHYKRLRLNFADGERYDITAAQRFRFWRKVS